MRKYIYNSRDVAAYFKYFSVPSYLEVSYMQFVFNLGNKVLAEPLTRDFESFKKEVYRELYFLWANGFEDEKADISKMTTEGELTLICDQECICLESYMKLICLLGIKCGVELYEDNCRKICESLQLEVKDSFGKPFDLTLGIPDELLRVSLNSEFKQSLDTRNFKETLRNEQMTWLKDLKDRSFKLFGSIPARKKTVKSRSAGSSDKNYRNSGNNVVRNAAQPKGTPKTNR